ncbi:arf-GAP domain and FG repeat-containing protein 1-like isoform X2 [Tigriopus californicus]|uniref:arf-GAP domain and FG repeat-containing protein 1-like isoform X2 n=1 Tax=Tigriopus californicus TaxID=6832 RepID=UPI0027D9E1F7|nr:arf-GAP domain and FG repeat-containing protein 1-like isoform X2 [Tigriopus californicus]
MRKAKGGGASGSGNTPMTESDKSAQQIRALQTSESNNKTCMDCGQRGPTYVNMTIGSFVCTKCSGMLRGINPPHRIKSISMSSFSADEIDFLRSRGNLWCQLVWLGLYEGHRSPEGMDEERVKEFIIEKYEKKRYYVDPSTIASTLPQPNQSSLGGWTPNEATSGRSNLIGSTLTGRLASGGGHAQTSRANADPSTSSVVSRPTNSQPQPSESSLQSKPDSSFLADFSAFSSGPTPSPAPLVSTSNANQGVDPFGSLSKSQPNTGTPSNFNANSETNDFFADFDGAQFDTPTIATPIPKPQASTSHNTPGSVSSSAFGAAPAWGATPPLRPLMQPKQQMVKQQATRPQSTPITNNQTAADKYAALKDLDEIFKSTVTLTDSPSGTTGVSIFGSSPIPASNLSKSLFEKESSTKGTGQSSLFDSTGNNDSWATSFNKLENTTSSNAGTTWDWADRNGAKPRANSAAGTTGVATSPVNPFTGAGNMSQLNTSPWPTTGTSPVNNPPASAAANWPPESASSNSNNSGTSASTGFESDPFATFNLQSGSKGNTMDFFGTGSQALDDPFATNKAPSAQGNGNFDAFLQTLTSPGNGAMGNGNPWTSSNVVQNDLFSVNNPGIPNSSKNSTNPFL